MPWLSTQGHYYNMDYWDNLELIIFEKSPDKEYTFNVTKAGDFHPKPLQMPDGTLKACREVVWIKEITLAEIVHYLEKRDSGVE